MEKASSSRTGENWQIDEFMARKKDIFQVEGMAGTKVSL